MPIQKNIPIYKPFITEKTKQYVMECLDSSWISSKGSFIQKFETAFASYINVPYALTTTNGTTALHLALLALDIGPGDEVIVPTLTYIASVNTIQYTGATPIFVDSLKTTWQMNPQEIAKKITSKTKAIVAVHLYGHPCDMDAITHLAKQHNLFLIEDCAEAIGSTHKEKHVGTFGDVATFSFYGNKTITTGEGGMVVTKHKNICNKATLLKSQGVSKTKEYWHPIIGYNYRMTNICAAIGLAQLETIDATLKQKKDLALTYKTLLQHLPIEFHHEAAQCSHSYWMVSILLPNEHIKNSIRKLLQKKQIETRPVFHPIHIMPMYKKENETYPIAENLSARGINLPSWPGLQETEIAYICDAIREFYMTNASKSDCHLTRAAHPK